MNCWVFYDIGLIMKINEKNRLKFLFNILTCWNFFFCYKIDINCSLLVKHSWKFDGQQITGKRFFQCNDFVRRAHFLPIYCYILSACGLNFSINVISTFKYVWKLLLKKKMSKVLCTLPFIMKVCKSTYIIHLYRRRKECMYARSATRQTHRCSYWGSLPSRKVWVHNPVCLSVCCNVNLFTPPLARAYKLYTFSSTAWTSLFFFLFNFKGQRQEVLL